MSIQRYEPWASAAAARRAQVPEADVLVDVEAELRRLDADLAVDLGGLDPREQLQVVVGDRLGAAPGP